MNRDPQREGRALKAGASDPFEMCQLPPPSEPAAGKPRDPWREDSLSWRVFMVLVQTLTTALILAIIVAIIVVVMYAAVYGNPGLPTG
jgi:nitrate reductase NapE component